jgi:hypothetical protein
MILRIENKFCKLRNNSFFVGNEYFRSKKLFPYNVYVNLILYIKIPRPNRSPIAILVDKNGIEVIETL